MRIGSGGIKRFSFSKPTPSWKRAEAWRSKMRAMRQSFESTSGALTNAVLTAQGNLASAQAELAVKMATKRAQEAALKRINEKVEDVQGHLENLKTDITV